MGVSDLEAALRRDIAEEDTLFDRPVRFSLDLEPREYAVLCRIICDVRVTGGKVSMRGLIRTALHQTYPQTAG